MLQRGKVLRFVQGTNLVCKIKKNPTTKRIRRKGLNLLQLGNNIDFTMNEINFYNALKYAISW